LLHALGFVVMDEVHYLADRMRGPVWEEVIIHLDASVQLVSLSATVSNAEEFGAWLQEARGDTEIVVSEIRPGPLWQHVVIGEEVITHLGASVQLVSLSATASNAEEFGAWLQEVRGDTEIVVSEIRPVPLWQHVVIGEELIDLFVDEKGRPAVSQGPGAREDRRVNPAIERITSFSVPVESRGGAGGRGGGGRDYRGRKGTGGRHRPRGSGQHRPPHKRRGGHDGGQRGGGVPRPLRRPEVIALLDDAALLPAI